MSRNPAPGFRRHPRVADRMTSAHFDLVAQSLVAERAATPPAPSSCTPPSRPSTSAAATTCCSPSSPLSATSSPSGCGRGGSRTRPCAARTPRRRQGRPNGSPSGTPSRPSTATSSPTATRTGADLVRVLAWVASESWLFHQVLVHEMGGMERFVDELATGRLAEHAELARSWAGARGWAATSRGEPARPAAARPRSGRRCLARGARSRCRIERR